MAEAAALVAGERGSSFDRIPGSDAYAELLDLLRDGTRFFHERFERYGRVWKTRLVYPVVFLIGEEANKTVLVTRRTEVSFGLGYAQTAVRRVFEGSIMLQDGDQHDRMRDLLNPAVGTLAVRESCEQVVALWDRAAHALREGGSRDAYELTQRGTFDVVANVLTGLALGAETEAFRPHFEKLIDGVMAPVPLRFPFGRLDRALRAREQLAKMMGPRVLAARERPPSGLVGQLAHHRDAAGNFLPVDEIVGHLLLLFWAGYDTTASAASWLLHVLADRVDWQNRLREELSAAGKELVAVVAEGELPQMNWVLLESERLYPSVLFFPRIALKDFEFQGQVIPKGTPTFYSPYMSHRDPSSFANPNVFDPERWNPALGERKARPAQLVGFGGGPRVCLGKAFAKLQLRAMLAVLLTRYRIAPDPTSRPTVLKLPVHHPVGSRIRFEAL